MKAKKARLYLLGLSLILGAMLIFRWMTPVTGSLIFAAGLLILGLLSGGFRRQ